MNLKIQQLDVIIETKTKDNVFVKMKVSVQFKVIQDKLTPPIKRPDCLIGDWHNFYCPDDFLTAFPLVNAPFDFQPAILNTSISTFISSPHKITGYLQHPAVIQNILEPILHPNPN